MKRASRLAGKAPGLLSMFLMSALLTPPTFGARSSTKLMHLLDLLT